MILANSYTETKWTILSGLNTFRTHYIVCLDEYKWNIISKIPPPLFSYQSATIEQKFKFK